jgi:DNA-binding transcriptional LysR family regulator
VQSLERDAGARLFERQSGRQAVLTEVGRSFLSHARDLAERMARMEADVAGRRGAAPAQVAICCQRSLAHTTLRAPLASFASGHRDIRLSIRIAFQEEVIAAVRMGAADLGCLLSNDEIPGLPSVLVGRERFVVFCAPDHPLAGRKRVPPADLMAHRFVAPVPSSMFGRTQAKLLASLGLDRIDVAAEATEFSTVRDLGVAGLGVCTSILPSVQPDLEAGRLTLVDLDAPPLFLDMRLLFNPQTRGAEPVRKLAEHLRETLASR